MTGTNEDIVSEYEEGPQRLKKRTYMRWEQLWNTRTKMMKWDSFQRLLTRLDFEIHEDSKSSSRKFVHPKHPSHPIFVHLPHGGSNSDTIGKDALGNICQRLTEVFGWQKDSFQPS